MKQMKMILAALLAAAFCLSIAGALAAGGTVWTTGSVNIRKGPGQDYEAVRSLSAGVKLEYDKTVKDDRGVTWYRISYKGSAGWVSSRYASGKNASGGSAAADGRVKILASVNLRTGPGLDYNNVCAIPEGTSLTYDEKKLDERGVAWYHVSYQGKSGWVSSRYARKQ